MSKIVKFPCEVYDQQGTGHCMEHKLLLKLRLAGDRKVSKMDTLIILVILMSLLAMIKFPARYLGLTLFWIALVASLVLFKFHVTSPLQLNF